MSVTNRLEDVITIPDGISVTMDKRVITVSGSNGKVTRNLDDRRVDIELSDDKMVLSTELPNKGEKALLGTYRSHVQNMIDGIQNDFEYKLKIIYSHFPVKVRVEKNNVIIENFIGEKKPRKARILEGAKVNIQGDLMTVSSADIEKAGQTAANIEAATKIKKVDPRVFQDGIYIIEKAGKPLR